MHSRLFQIYASRNKKLEARIIILGAMIIMTALTQGCISLEIPSADGKPKLIGFGRVNSIPCQSGQIYQLTAPGISFRLGSFAPGISLGWHQTTLFFPPNNTNNSSTNSPVAIQKNCIGLNFTPTGFMLGADRSFAIPMPAKGSSLIQYISYSSHNLTNTIIHQQTTK